MNVKISSAIFSALLLAAPVLAEDKPAPAPTARESVLTFFRHLKDALATSAVQGERKRARTGSVAAVRGADQSSSLADPNEPVLIGDARAKKDKAALAEDAEFAKAVDAIVAGKIADGIQGLEGFESRHPKSRNLDKVHEAIEQAKLLSADKPPLPAAAASAAPPAPASAAPSAPAPATPQTPKADPVRK